MFYPEWLEPATAESCTAGGLAYACTQLAGSSNWFIGGIVAYSNAIKQHVLTVDADLLARHGAVSEPVAIAMAQGVQKKMGTQWAMSTSGIAGPGGGSAQKPVGMVCFAWVYQDQLTVSQTQHFAGDRQQVRAESIVFALRHLLSLQETIST